MPALALLCDVQRLLPRYTAGAVHFSVNMSVAVKGGPVAKADLDLLLPWRWIVQSFHLRGIKSGVVSKKLLTATLVAKPSPPKQEDWFKSLESVRDRFAADEAQLDARFAWGGELRQEAAKLPWHAFLMQASNFPDALPHAANLAFIVSVPEQELIDGMFDEVIAAAAFTLPNGDVFEPGDVAADLTITNASKPIAFAGIGPGIGQGPKFYRWELATASTAVAAESFQRECVLAPDIKKRFLRMEDGWVGTPDGEPDHQKFTGEDWTARLESRLEDVFDLTQRLIDVIRLEGEGQDWLPAARRAAVGALRDASGTGMDDPKSPPAENVFRRAGAKNEWATFGPVLAAKRDITLEKWAALVVTVTGQQVDLNNASLEAEPVAAELSALAGALSDPATVREVVFRQWNDVLENDPGTKPLWTKALQDRVRRDLEEHQFRRSLLRENLMNAWTMVRGIDDKTDDLTQLLALMKKALRMYFETRFRIDTVTNVPFNSYTPITADVDTLRDKVLPVFTAVVKDYVDNYGSIIRGDANVSSDKLAETSVPDGIVIQVDRVAGLESDAGEGKTGDQEDLLRRIAGVGVLVRRQSGPWSCLNFADVEVQKVPKPDEEPAGPASVLDRALVASRLGYRNGVRQSFVVYNNQPLVADSPMNVISEGRLDDLREETAPGDLAASFFHYANCYGSSGPTLPRLAYGEVYDAAVFIVGNAGVLPPPLVATDGAKEPWRMRPLAGIIDADFDQYIRKGFKYRRRVPVGAVRVGRREAATVAEAMKLKGAFRNIELPIIPNTVVPITRSLPVEHKGVPEAGRPLLMLRPPSDPKDPERPLDRWSTMAQKNFEFVIRPPSCDLQVWDRWVSESIAVRKEVWGGFFEGADRFGGSVDPTNEIDLSIDDPAVSKFKLTLSRVHGPNAAPPSRSIPVDLGSAGTKGLARVQTAPRTIRVEAIDSGDADLISTTNGALLKVPAGEVWRLTIALEIPDTAESPDKARFHPNVVAPNKLPPPYEIDIEVADDQMPSAAKLHEALKLQADEKGERLRVLLAAPPLAERIHRVDVMLQQWRWAGRPIFSMDQGRPVYGFPFKDVASGAADGQLFADRQSSDHLVLPASVDFVAKPSAHTLEDRDVSGNPGALYYRAAIRAYSRYEGLLITQGVDSRRAAVTSQQAERWQRAVVRSRWNKELPPPSVRLIVPLTRPVVEVDKDEGTAPTAAPLLVVCDTPAFETGGLAEELVAEITTAESPYRPTVEEPVPAVGDLPEFGPDPILTIDPTKGRPAQTLRVIGPIGYTFDTDTQAPLFVKSSYILPPPETTPAERDLSWHFAKIRFKRRLAAQGMADGVARESSPTPAVWAQFLPPSTHFRAGAATHDVAALRCAIEGETLRILDVKDQPVVLDAQPTLQLYVLVTSVVADALSRRDQETFDSLWELGPDGIGRRTPAAGAGVPDNPRRARIVEVQRREKGAELFDDLFPKVTVETLANADDVKARIVRVSPPLFAT